MDVESTVLDDSLRIELVRVKTPLWMCSDSAEKGGGGGIKIAFHSSGKDSPGGFSTVPRW